MQISTTLTSFHVNLAFEPTIVLYYSSSLSGTWSTPKVSGQIPPPCAYFSFTKIDHHRVLLYGGERYGQKGLSDLYILDLTAMVSQYIEMVHSTYCIKIDICIIHSVIDQADMYILVDLFVHSNGFRWAFLNLTGGVLQSLEETPPPLPLATALTWYYIITGCCW